MPRTPRGPGTPRGPLRGDRSKRVTVALPDTLHDLENIASRHFPNHKLGIYHKGARFLRDQQQYTAVHDDDVVIIRQGTPDAGPAFNGISTHMATYVQHPLEARRRPEAPAARPAPPAFTGRTCYQGDYVEYPFEDKDQGKPPELAWVPAHIPMTSRSNYVESYPWHDPVRRAPAKPAAHHASPPPFHGNSSYRQDYIKHEIKRPHSARAPRRDLVSAPFDGFTTYTTDYKNYPHSPSRPVWPMRQEVGPTLPFQGRTEYQNEYIKKQKTRTARLHIEPEDTRRR